MVIFFKTGSVVKQYLKDCKIVQGNWFRKVFKEQFLISSKVDNFLARKTIVFRGPGKFFLEELLRKNKGRTEVHPLFIP
jgi:hypothetical protein